MSPELSSRPVTLVLQEDPFHYMNMEPPSSPCGLFMFMRCSVEHRTGWIVAPLHVLCGIIEINDIFRCHVVLCVFSSICIYSVVLNCIRLLFCCMMTSSGSSGTLHLVYLCDFLSPCVLSSCLVLVSAVLARYSLFLP